MLECGQESKIANKSIWWVGRGGPQEVLAWAQWLVQQGRPALVLECMGSQMYTMTCRKVHRER